MALLADGTMITWGFNDFGELCDGTIERRSLPEPVFSNVIVNLLARGALSCCFTLLTGCIERR